MLVKSIRVKLRPSEICAQALHDTMQAFSDACNHLSQVAWNSQIFRQYDLHSKAYHPTRSLFPALPSQLVVRAIRVVTDSYKIDRSSQHAFGSRSAVVFDSRVFKMLNRSSVQLTTTKGRFKFLMASGGKQYKELEGADIGEADLLLRDANFYLSITVKKPEPPSIDSNGVLGVDLGIVAIATDSDGEAFSGQQVKEVRMRLRRHRSLLQAVKTRSARKRLQKIRRRQSRFVSDVNHCISKHLVRKASLLQKALSMEDLTQIRTRSHGLNKAMRWLMGNWSFADLAAKVAYKANALGVPLHFVDPAYTSQTCSSCGHCERANRKSQSDFECNYCGLLLNADRNGALNVKSRAENWAFPLRPALLSSNGSLRPALLSSNGSLRPALLSSNGSLRPALLSSNGSLRPALLSSNGSLRPALLSSNGSGSGSGSGDSHVNAPNVLALNLCSG